MKLNITKADKIAAALILKRIQAWNCNQALFQGTSGKCWWAAGTTTITKPAPDALVAVK